MKACTCGEEERHLSVTTACPECRCRGQKLLRIEGGERKNDDGKKVRGLPWVYNYYLMCEYLSDFVEVMKAAQQQQTAEQKKKNRTIHAFGGSEGVRTAVFLVVEPTSGTFHIC